MGKIYRRTSVQGGKNTNKEMYWKRKIAIIRYRSKTFAGNSYWWIIKRLQKEKSDT